MDEVYPVTRHQRCWQHKAMNMLNCLPKLSQPKVKAAIHDIGQTETKDDANRAFFEFPAQHWQSIRTTNPIECTFTTIRRRTKLSKGCLSRDGMLHLIFKLSQCAEQNRKKLRGVDYLTRVITGVTFRDGIETTRDSQIAAWPKILKHQI